MSLFDEVFGNIISNSLEKAPQRLGNLWEIAKERPIVTVGIVGGLFIGTSSPLAGTALIVIGLWRLIGLPGLIFGAFVLALIGAGL